MHSKIRYQARNNKRPIWKAKRKMTHLMSDENLPTQVSKFNTWKRGEYHLLSQADTRYTIILIGLSALMIIGLTIFVPGFLTLRNLTNVFAQTGVVGLLAIGFSFLI